LDSGAAPLQPTERGVPATVKAITAIPASMGHQSLDFRGKQRGAETVSRDTRYQLREQELQALGKVSAPRQERRSRARSRLAIHPRRFLVPSRIAFRLCSYAPLPLGSVW